MNAASAGTFNYKVVRQFTVMTVVWGIVGMLVGVIIAAQLLWPELNFDIPWLSYGRLRPLHTNAVIFAFGGCALFATAYYVVQRTCQVRLFSDALAAFTFWGWQAVIVLAAVTLPLGYTSGKEYAELEWPIDILITLVWVAYAVVFFGTIAKRKTPHIYVANWFFGAFILTIALLHVINSAEMPVTFWPMKSYSAYAGVQDAMVQWWYGHNAVGFFLTAGFLGMMYYFVPKQAGRPVYSYRLSVVHFWALIFTYMWAGPHHLHYTALPDWTQSLGMLFSLILLAPSWGGMINGIMTLSGAWHKLRDDPILKFLIVSLSFYGMSTFEGPMMSIKTVNALSHYTDWTIGHVHSGALGWVAFISIGCDLLPDPADVRQDRDVVGPPHHRALLDRDDRRRPLHRLDVDRRRDAGPDVARRERRRHAHLRVRREREGDLPVLRDPSRRRGAVPRRHADHGVQHDQDDRGQQGRRGADPRSPAPRRTPEAGIPESDQGTAHENRPGIHRAAHRLDDRIDHSHRQRGRARRDRPAVLPEVDHHAGRRRQALHAAAADRPRRLPARGLLQLPLADDPAVPRGDRALRATIRSPANSSTTIRSSGAASARGRISRASAGAIRTTGTGCTSPIRATSCPSRTCPATPGSRRRRRALSDIEAKMRALRRVGVPYTDAEIAKAPAELKDRTEEDALIAYLQMLGLAMKNAR